MLTKEQLKAIEKVLSISESQRDPFRRYAILAMQMWDIAKCIEYMKAYSGDEFTYKAHKAHLKTALGDLLVQTVIMCILYDFDVNEILELGIERLKEFRRKKGFTE